MTERVFRLRIPVERWTAAEYVPAAAAEAAELASSLTERTTSVDLLAINGSHLPIAPTRIQIVTNLRYRHDGGSFATQFRIMVAPANVSGNLGSVEVHVTTTWSAPGGLDVMPDTAHTFALSFGCLEPLSKAAQTITDALPSLSE